MRRLLTLLGALILIVAAGITTDTFATVDGYVYSNAYDGFTNIRESPSTKAAIVGILPNGNYPAEVVTTFKHRYWYYIYYRGCYGYVAKSQIDRTPAQSVNLDITAKWLAGSWCYNNNTITLDTNGNFMFKDCYGKDHAGKWRLSGGNYITFKASWDDWQGVYPIDLYSDQIGPYTRTKYTPTPTRGPAPAQQWSNYKPEPEPEYELALRYAAWSSALTDKELMTILYDSATDTLPEEFSWIVGEWHCENGSSNLAIITPTKIRTYDSSKSSKAPENSSYIKASEYTIRYKYEPNLRRYFLAVVPKGNLPEVYITHYDDPNKMFYIDDDEATMLKRVGDAEISSSTSVILIVIIAVVIVAIICIAILFAQHRKQ